MDFIILLLKSIVVWSSSINWWEEIFYSLHRNSSVLENMVYAWRKFICSFLILFLLKSITKIHPIAYNQFWLKNILATSLLLDGCHQKDKRWQCWRGYGEKGTLPRCWWERKLVQPLWRTIWRSLKRLRIEPPHDAAIPFLATCPEETRS